MSLRRVALPEVPGGLWLSAMPGRAAPLADVLAAAADARIGHVLCLTGETEIAEKSPGYAALLTSGELPWKWHHHPIGDFDIPPDAGTFAEQVGDMTSLLCAGERLALHCGAGIGRTGMVAICLLVRLGLEPADAARRIEKAGSHPETPEQLAFVARFSAGDFS